MVIRRAEIEIERWIERHMPNNPVKLECVTMYRLRCKESPLGKKSFDPSRIVFT